jgi:hypothetical protein
MVTYIHTYIDPKPVKRQLEMKQVIIAKGKVIPLQAWTDA